LLKQFILNSAVTTVLKFLSAALKFLMIIYITNKFGASEYGAFTFAMSIFLMVNLVFRYGFDIYMQKEVALLEEKKKYLTGISQFINVTYFSVVSLIIVTVLVEIVLYNFSMNIDTLKYNYLSVMFLFSFLYAIMWIFTYYYRGIGRGKTSVFNLEILFPIIQIISIYGLSELNLQVYLILIYSFSIAMLFSILVYIFNIKERIKNLIFYSKKTLPKLQIKHIKQSYPFLLVSMSTMILAWTDIFVISYFETNENIGIYSVVTKIGLLMLFPASAVIIYFSNKVVVFINKRNYTKLNKYFKIATFGLFTISLLMFIVINYYNEYLLFLFGDVFTSATTTLLIFTFAQLINGTTGVFESIFLMSDLKYLFMKLNTIMIIVNIFLNIPLIYFYGINGAATATLVVISINKVIQLYIINKKVLSLKGNL